MKRGLHDQSVEKAVLVLIAGVVLIIVAVWPMFAGLLAERLHLSVAQQGWIISTESFGNMAGTALSAWLCRRHHPARIFVFCGLLGVAANILTAHSEQLSTVLSLRFLAGVAGGLAYSVAVFHLSRMPGQDRAFGLLLALQTFFFSAYAAVFPVIAQDFGGTWATYSLGVWFLIALVLTSGLSGRLRSLDRAFQAQPKALLSHLGRSTVLALAGMGFLQFAIFAVWGFIANVASAKGISETDIGLAFGVGLAGGMPGAALAGVLGTRLGRKPMILLGSMMVLGSILMLAAGPENVLQLMAATVLMNLGWMLALSFYMGMVATSDQTGTASSLIGFVQIAAGTLAPVIVSLLISDDSLQPIFIVSSLGAVLAGVLPLAAYRQAPTVQAIRLEE